MEDEPPNIMCDNKMQCLPCIIYNKSSWYMLDHCEVRMLMSYHQCPIMQAQLQGYIIVDLKIYYNIILMNVYNVYQGISFPPHFPDVHPPRFP